MASFYFVMHLKVVFPAVVEVCLSICLSVIV